MKRYITGLLLVCMSVAVSAQKDYQVIDEIIAVVGNEIVLLSEVESQKGQLLANGAPMTSDLGCQVTEAILFEKLMLHQARVDSIDVSEDRIQGELDRRIRVFAGQMGGEEKLAEFYGKSIAEIRNEFHDAIKEQLLVQNMQQTITQDVRITPADVEQFYNSIPVDSIPFIESEVEVSQILIKPEPSEEEIQRVKDRLNEIKAAVEAGTKDFETQAVLYSMDDESAKRGGELGMVGRGALVPEFEQVAYNLAEGQVSRVFKSDFGYHLVQMIERKGEYFNARHILIKPKVTRADLQSARERLTEIKELIAGDSLNFEQAAATFSDDEGTRNNNGILINPASGSIRFKLAELDPQLFLMIDKLEAGEISEPSLLTNQQNDQAYRLVKLRYRSDAHRADLVEDYQLLQEMTRGTMTDEVVGEWLDTRIAETYIQLKGDARECNYEQQWLKTR